MNSLLAQVKELKDSARSSRVLGLYEDALEDLDEAIALLEGSGQTSDADDDPSWESKVAAQLADCHGQKGGVYREVGDLDKSVESYDAGYVYESDPRFKIVSSYNLLQRLVSRVLRTPEVLADDAAADANRLPEGRTIPEALADAARIIDEQLQGPRRGESWAIADFAIAHLLLNDESFADKKWDEFDAANPTSHAYGTTAEVVRALAQKDTPIKDALARAAERLERR